MVRTLAAEGEALGRAAQGLERHARAVSALILAGGLAQGLADARLEQENYEVEDEPSTLAMEVACGFAGLVAESWDSGFERLGPAPSGLLDRMARLALPERITVKVCEGYAFYAVYPELYLRAARSAFPGPAPRVIGLRSIGTSLAAVVAVGAGAAIPLTVRPTGDPLDRKLRFGGDFARAIQAPSPGGFAVVDEGPGRSGSSFAAVGEALVEAGARPKDIVYLPSHEGGPGAEAGEPRRRFWREARRARVDFDDLIAPRLAGWVEPLIGPLKRPLEDLSGGAWRHERADTPPTWPEHERRKYRATTAQGRFLLKFAGLGDLGPEKLRRALALHEAGFAPEPFGLVHGFLVQAWIETIPPMSPARPPDEVLTDHLARYLGFRARALPAGRGQGAALADLTTMIRRNLGLAGLNDLAEQAARLSVSEAMAVPVQVDGRLQAWEWLRALDGRFLKADALDHCQGHDLIGAQDIAWDVAGAAVELRLDPDAAERLRRSVEREAGRPVDRALVEFMSLAYLAFQLGSWRLAGEGGGGEAALAQAQTYERICTCRMAG